MISTCHSGFVDLISEYKEQMTGNKNQTTLDFNMWLTEHPYRLTLTKDKYNIFEKQMSYYTLPATTARLANIVSLINVLAMSG